MRRAFSLLLIAGAPATAQTANPVLEPTIEFRARVRADRLEVRQKGEAKVTVRAEPGVTVDASSRGNLPDPLTPGVYRDVDVTLDLRATVDESGARAESEADATAAPER